MTRQLALTNGTLVDGNGGNPVPDATVVMKSGRFAAVGPTTSVEIPDGAEIIDVRGRWILPGLVNGNVHLLDAIMMMGIGGTEYLARFEGQYHRVIEEAAQVALRSGMTTIFDTWNALIPVLKARDRIASGQVPGARIFAAGNIVGMGGPFSPDFLMQARQVISKTFADRVDSLFDAGVGRHLSTLPPEEVRAIVRDYIGHGIDFLKVAVSDHLVGMLGFRSPYFTFSDRVLRVIVEEVRNAGIPLLTHTTSVESLHAAVEHGADLLIHATHTAHVSMPDETIDKIVQKGLFAEVQPVTDAHQAFLERTNNPLAEYAGRTNYENDARMIKAGARLVLGTDAGCTDPDVLGDEPDEALTERPWTLGQDHFLWMQAMVERGMEPMAAIVAGTSQPAKAYGKFEEFGSVEVGKLADLVVVDADPLADINNMRRISIVIKDGERVDTAALPIEPLATSYPRTADSER